MDNFPESKRELGLDYEPVGLIDRLTNPEQHYEFTNPKKANAVLMSLCQEAADALAAPVQPMAHIVGEIDHTGKVWKPVQPAPESEPVDTDELTILWMLINAWRDAPAPALHICGKINSYVLALKQPTPPAQPAVPDAMTSADIQENIEYVAGWNDCRQAMMEMMK
jgi:hypothetical protein